MIKNIILCGFALMFSTPAFAEEGDETSQEAPIDNEVLQASDLLSKKNEQIVKTLQRKNFLKLRRWELSPHVAFVTNDPFLNRYIIGTGIAYHLTEIFSIEAATQTGNHSPNSL